MYNSSHIPLTIMFCEWLVFGEVHTDTETGTETGTETVSNTNTYATQTRTNTSNKEKAGVWLGKRQLVALGQWMKKKI